MPRLVEFYMRGKLHLEDWISAKLKLPEINDGFANMEGPKPSALTARGSCPMSLHVLCVLSRRAYSGLDNTCNCSTRDAWGALADSRRRSARSTRRKNSL